MNFLLTLAASCILSGNAAITPPAAVTAVATDAVELRNADAEAATLESVFESRYLTWDFGLLPTLFRSTPGGGFTIRFY